MPPRARSTRPARAARGPGEGARAVAEQLTLEEARRDGAGIDLDQGTGGAGPGAVDRARQRGPAGARLAHEKQGRRALGRAIQTRQAPLQPGLSAQPPRKRRPLGHRGLRGRPAVHG